MSISESNLRQRSNNNAKNVKIKDTLNSDDNMLTKESLDKEMKSKNVSLKSFFCLEEYNLTRVVLLRFLAFIYCKFNF
jgi:hypothetical protein